MTLDLGHDGFPVSANYFSAVPDTGTIADAHLAVIYKLLLKKDAVTKEKALADLINFIQDPNNQQSVEDDQSLVAWSQAYCKLALDNSRNVRLLAHRVEACYVKSLGKLFSRYLKSTMAVWLQGLFDTDRQVASATEKSLVEAFGLEKVEKLWTIFSTSVISYIATIVTVETHETLSDKRNVKEEDSVAKYERALNSVLRMLTVLILKNVESSYFDDIFNSDVLWTNLGTSVASGNMPLFKTYLHLIKTLFQDSLDNVDQKSLYKVVSKKFIKFVKLNHKTPVVYSNVIVQLWDTLVVLTQFSGSKKNFWQLGGSKSYSRLTDYLKLGPCNLTPVYYTLIEVFMAKLAEKELKPTEDWDFIDFSSEKSAKTIIVKILLPQLGKNFDFAYDHRLVLCLIAVYELFSAEAFLPQMVYAIEDAISRNVRADKKPLKDECVEKVSLVATKDALEAVNGVLVDVAMEKAEFSAGEYTFKNKPTEVAKIHLQIVQKGQPELLSKFVVDLLEGLEEHVELAKPVLAFSLVIMVLDQKPVLSDEAKEHLASFIETLPGFVETDFVDLPLALLALTLAYVDVSSESVDDFYTKISLDCPSETHKLLQFLHQYQLLDKHPRAQDVLVELSTKKNKTDHDCQFIFQFSDDAAIFENLVKTTDADLFIRHFSNMSILEDSEVQQTFVEILKKAWSNLESHTLLDTAREKDLEILKISLYDYILDGNFSAYAVSYISNHFEVFPLDRLMEIVYLVISSTNLDLLAIANPLEQNVCLAQKETKSSGSDSSLLALGELLCLLLKRDISPSLYALAAFVSECLSDVSFLSLSEHDVNEAMEIGQTLHESVVSYFDLTVSEILTLIHNGKEINLNSLEGPQDVVAFFCQTTGTVTDFFYARVLVRVLLKFSVDAEFESLDINLTKLAATPFKLAVVLVAFKDHLDLSKFDRIRNYVAAEILGVKPDQILTNGLKWLTLSMNFLRKGGIPQHRLAMIINQIALWMESDVAYDDEFIVMRSQLARFFTGLLNDSDSLPDKFWEVATTLCTDNLATAQVEAARLDLRYFTLKLCYELHRKGADIDCLEEVIELISNEKIAESDAKINNQPLHMNHDLVVRYFGSVDVKPVFVEGKVDVLYGILHKSRFQLLQRVATGLLEAHILRTQQDFVLEHQLSKAEDKEAKLPESLLEVISDTEIFEENPTCFLWSWLLVFAHFKDVTYSIRNSYVAQLRSLDVVNPLLDTVFDHVYPPDLKFSAEQYENYSVFHGDEVEETSVLLVHLYYLSFRHLASDVQSWYNTIRDKQLQKIIDKFSVTVVSPLIINKILDDVASAKDRITSKEENMTIKVNRVTNEIRSVYVIDEQTMEMVVKIPKSYPLGSVSVEGPLRLGVKETQWKAWLLASQKIITLTNGSILEAVELFNKNVNLHFSGFEDCAICYSILHQDHSLPSKTCPTCLNKFHAACLYKWFKSSGASTCPMCRSAFNFRK